MTEVAIVFDVAVKTELLALFFVDFGMVGQEFRIVGHFNPMAFLTNAFVVAPMALVQTGLLCFFPVAVRPIFSMRHLKVTSPAICFLMAEPAA